MLVSSTLASLMLSRCRCCLVYLRRSPNVSLSRVARCCCRAVSSGVGKKSLSQHGCQDCSAVTTVLIHSWWQHLTAWVASSASVPVSDRTLDVLIDHLHDLDLPTILARMANRSEPYIIPGHETHHNVQVDALAAGMWNGLWCHYSGENF